MYQVSKGQTLFGLQIYSKLCEYLAATLNHSHCQQPMIKYSVSMREVSIALWRFYNDFELK